MAGFLGALEYVLEEGPRNDWFSDDSIVVFAWVSGISALVFFYRALTARSPIVDLSAFANRNFALGSLFSFVLGIGLYGLTLVYPLYLAQIRGYDALMIGETMFVSGLAMFLTAPFAGRMTGKVDPRLMLLAGFLFFAAGTYWMTSLTRDWDFWELLWPQIFRGVGLMLAMVPINNVALGTLSADRVKNASGLYNLMRNLGGAVGLAGIYTFLNDRTDLHIARLHENFTAARPSAVEALNNMVAKFSSYGADAKAMALKQMTQIAHRQASVMAFADVFLALTVLFVVLAALAVLVKKPAAAGGAGGGH
jgi:DHA2 family multidrug resistance protein